VVALFFTFPLVHRGLGFLEETSRCEEVVSISLPFYLLSKELPQGV